MGIVADVAEVEDVKHSLGRAILNGDVIGRFYEIFLDSNAGIKPLFVNTDLSKQKKLLHQGLNLAIMYADGSMIGKTGINRIQKSHSRSAMNISPILYPYWKRSLIQAISEFDPKFTPKIKSEWDRTLQKAIDHICAGYNN